MIGRFGGKGPAPELSFNDLFFILIIVCGIMGLATGSIFGFIIFIMLPFAGYYFIMWLSRWIGFKYIYYSLACVGFISVLFKLLVN